MALSRFTTRGIGTALTALSTAPATGFTNTFVGLSLCNTSGAMISVDFLLRETGPLDTYILKTFNIPAGETVFPWGQLGKGVAIAGDVIYAKSSAAASLDVVAPYYKEAA